MNILVTGSNGQLGKELRRAAQSSEDKYIFTDVSEGEDTLYLDITDEGAVSDFCSTEEVDVIVNCAAYTDVDAAENDAIAADKLNHLAPSALAKIAARSSAVLIHISTDYVFDGKANTPYSESSATSPASVYGTTKLAGEQAIKDSGCKYIIIRTAWLYSAHGRNFVKTIGNLCMEKPSLKVVVDQVGSPTYAGDLALAIMHIIDTRSLDKCGLYHFSNEGSISWYDLAKAVAASRGSDCLIEPCMSSEYPSRVARPHYSVLDKTLFKQTFSYSILYWRDSLSKCIAELWK